MINQTAENFFQKRGIDPELASKLGVTTSGEGSSTVIAFPFLENDTKVACKFRGPKKKFWQEKDGKKTFWNNDAILLACEADKPLIITEGEMDALSVLEAGYSFVVSVPDGAPAKEITDEESSKFDYVKNNLANLERVKTIVLAADNDNPGKVLNAELARRLGEWRCKFVTYPEGCKDFNEVLVQHGKEGVWKVINGAKDYPVAGLYRLSDFPDVERPAVYTTGLPCMNDHTMLELGRLMVITGIPGHGKSEVADNIIYHCANVHKWPCLVASFENAPSPHWRDKLLRKMLRCDPQFAQHDRKKASLNWINSSFEFIAQNPSMDEDEDLTIDKIIELAEISVIRNGTKVLLIDPWNEIEHQRKGGESEHDYTDRAIRKLKRFAKAYGVLVIIVAHPVKMNEGGKVHRPSPYSISGSSNWYNKPDYVWVVWRPDLTSSLAEVHVAKVKNQDYMGKPGQVDLDYDTLTGTYTQYVSDREFNAA